MKLFSTENLERVFAKPENDYDGFKQMLFDYTHGKEIFDEDGNRVSNATVNAKINKVCFDILGIEQGSKPSKREIRRAMKKHGMELFEVIEDILDFKVTTGFQDNEFFDSYVEYKNIAEGDRNEFWTNKDVILTVAQFSGDHHDLTLQKLAEGESTAVKTYDYAVKVGMDIDLYLLGRRDWSELVDAVARAFQVKVKTDIFAAVMSAGEKLPTNEQFNKTDELSVDTKADFDELISDVSAANDGAEVAIIGLDVDLKKLDQFADVDWASEQDKIEHSQLGRLGHYGPHPLIAIPQRFAYNDVTKKLITPGKLLIMPNVENKFVKFIDVGETEIYEVTNKNDYRDDFMTYEVQREMGTAVLIDKYFGVWNITA